MAAWSILFFGIGLYCTWGAFRPREMWRMRESWRYRNPALVEESLDSGTEAVGWGIAAVVSFGTGIVFLVLGLTGFDGKTECDRIMTDLIEGDSVRDTADELGVELEDRDSIVLYDVEKDGQRLGWVNLATEDYSCSG